MFLFDRPPRASCASERERSQGAPCRLSPPGRLSPPSFHLPRGTPSQPSAARASVVGLAVSWRCCPLTGRDAPVTASSKGTKRHAARPISTWAAACQHPSSISTPLRGPVCDRRLARWRVAFRQGLPLTRNRWALAVSHCCVLAVPGQRHLLARRSARVCCH